MPMSRRSCQRRTGQARAVLCAAITSDAAWIHYKITTCLDEIDTREMKPSFFALARHQLYTVKTGELGARGESNPLN